MILRRPMRRFHRLLSCAWMTPLVIFAGCAVGPDFHRPAGPASTRLTSTDLPFETAGGEHDDDRPQRFFFPSLPADRWWQSFGSPAIDALVDRSLASNPTVAAAQATLRQAQELAAVQRGLFYPSVQASYSPSRGRVADVVSSPLSSNATLYSLQTAQLSIGYVADVFGGNQRLVEAADAQTESQWQQFRAARISLTANVVNTVLQVASVHEQLAATERIATIAEQQLKLLQVQRQLGAAPGAAVFAQEVVLRQSEANAAALKKQLAQQRNLLAVLVGTMPGDFSADVPSLSSLVLPDIPLVLPAVLVDKRPDVRAAEAQVHVANAQVGAAIANLLPQISLTANLGQSALTFGQLFRAGGLAWSVAAGVVQPLFQGGQLMHRKRAAEAQLEVSLAQYQSAVLTAFQNVADTLEAVRFDAEQYQANSRQQSAAETSLRIARRQVELGDISYLALLNAETASLQAAIAKVQASSSRFSDVVAMFQALGGDWLDQPVATSAK